MTGVQGDPRAIGSSVLEGKVVVVSGVGPDLGRALALRSAVAGADVVLAARTESRLREVADEVLALGRKPEVVPTDVTDDGSVSNLVERALAAFGRVDGLVNAAFAPPPQIELLKTDPDEVGRFHDINALASLRLTQKFAPALIETGGSVVMINSMIIRNRHPRFGAYRMTKASLLAAARSLSVELGPRGVRVNSVLAGYIWADKVAGYFQRIADGRGVSRQQVYDEVAANVDLRKLPEPDEIADAAVFLLSDMARGLAGQCIDVTCGETHH